jgi:3-oxoacyl-[acyl-carrier-protein] synthase III
LKEIGIRRMDFAFGDRREWYRAIEGIDATIAGLGLPDSESFWGWGHFHRYTDDYRGQVTEVLRDLVAAGSSPQVDGIVVCAPCRLPAERLLEPFVADVAAGLGLSTHALRLVEGFDCVNIVRGLEQAGHMIADGAREILVVAAERAESEQKRFRKFALFGDACFAMTVSGDLFACEYEVLAVDVAEDPAPPESTDGVLGRKLDARLVREMLDASGCDARDVEQCVYINLYKPISEMKVLDMGFARRQHYTGTIEDIGHCYGIDPFYGLHRHAASAAPDAIYVLGASSREYAGAAVVRKI